MLSSIHEQQAGEWETVGGPKTVAHLIHQGEQDPSSSLFWLMSDVVDSSAVFFFSPFRIPIAKCLIVAAEEVRCHHHFLDTLTKKLVLAKPCNLLVIDYL
jgi:hypothetical protein